MRRSRLAAASGAMSGTAAHSTCGSQRRHVSTRSAIGAKKKMRQPAAPRPAAPLDVRQPAAPCPAASGAAFEEASPSTSCARMALAMILRRRRVILVRRYCCDWAVKSCRKHTNNNKEYILKQKDKTKTENIYIYMYLFLRFPLYLTCRRQHIENTCLEQTKTTLYIVRKQICLYGVLYISIYFGRNEHVFPCVVFSGCLYR